MLSRATAPPAATPAASPATANLAGQGVTGVERTQAMERLQQHLGMDAGAVTRMLWSTYHPWKLWIPFVAPPIFAAMERIDKNLLEAAADLGCKPWQAFLRVTLPLSLPGIAAGFFFAFIPTLGEFVTPLLVGGSSGVMYGNLIQDQFMRALNWPMGSVMSLAMLLMVMILVFLLTRLSSASDLTGF